MVAGLERKSRLISPKEKEIVAYHEAGHALGAESRQHADRIAKISIIPRGVAARGYAQQQPTEDRYLVTRAELLDRLEVLLGRRTAEEIIFGDVSTGAQDDLQRATDLVRHMITRYGMSDALGLATFEAPRPALFLPVPSGAPREYSEETARRIDAEIQQFLEAAHTPAHETLTAQRTLLESLGKLRITHEVVDRHALLRLRETTVPAEAPDAPMGKSVRQIREWLSRPW
jgi:cell division protease FtsH